MARFQIPKSRTIAARYEASVIADATRFAREHPIGGEWGDADMLQRLVRPAIDGGEALFLAALTKDVGLCLVSGYKKALAALAAADDLPDVRDRVSGRIACAEQVVQAFIRRGKFYAIRDAMLSATDATFRIVFSRGAQTAREDAEAGLVSYIEHLRQASGDMPVAEDKLNALLGPP